MIKAMKEKHTQTLLMMSILLVFVFVFVMMMVQVCCTGSECIKIKITRWEGRLGNNISQLFNAIQISLYYACNISIPNHNLFDTSLISRLVTNSIDSEKFVDINLQKQLSGNELKGDFYFDLYKYDKRVFEYNIQQTVLILKESFKIRQDKTCDLGENHVVLHIRGGDIFSKNPHGDYINPPIYYFKTILDSNNYKRIILISEDRLNPTVGELLKLYPNIEFKIQSLEEDIKLLLASKNVIMSFGTFVPRLLTLSNRIEKMYKPSYAGKTFTEEQLGINLLTKLGIEVHDFELSDYFNKQSPWKNNELQRDLLINYLPST
jgi:hypothetical protein